MKLVPIVVALIAAITLSSGLVEVNLEHHTNLPPEFSNKTSITQHRVVGWNGTDLCSTVSDIRLRKELKDTDSINDILKVLQEAQAGDVINFHLAGVGGQVDTFILLRNSVQQSKAHVRMIVEAPVYSAHAFLSVSGNELIMMPNTYLMFHTSSGYGVDCTKQTGEDRAVSNAEHCQSFLNTHLANFEQIIDSINLLTLDEKIAIKTGHDVYITDSEYNRRTSK
jgi:ATP-dependent protease ClpP protease subunit